MIDRNAGSSESGVPVVPRDRNAGAARFVGRGGFVLAVIRVTDIVGHSPSKTADEISENIFGTGSDSYSIVSGDVLVN